MTEIREVNEPYVWLYKIRGVAMAPPVLFFLFCFWRETEVDSVIWPAGIGLFYAGVSARIWAQMHLHYRLQTRKKLTTTGPYSHVRNPIYLANTVMLLSLTVLSELLWFLPLMIAWCMVVYGFVVRREEAHLLEKYGEDYAAYLTTVSRWIPRSNRQGAVATNVGEFLWPSIATEVHCFLFIVPLFGKELLSRFL